MDIINTQNRIFKFRVWDHNLKKFIENFNADPHISCWNGTVYCYERQKEGGDVLVSGIRNITVQQYTGMKDKNGKEIYEGDILSEKQWNGNEIFGEVKWVSKIDGYDWSGWYSYPVSLPRITSTDCVVVGNIFENPKLLKQNEQ
jgi:uncharacterized phage protein (TIGR01671 family)